MNESNHIPGDPIPVGVYVRDELEARGWTALSAAQLTAPEGKVGEWELWLELIICVEIWQEQDPRHRFGHQEAERLEHIFSVSAETWMNIHETYEQKRRAAKN